MIYLGEERFVDRFKRVEELIREKKMSIVSTMDSKKSTDELRHINVEEQRFTMEAKRNKKLAIWVAEQIGLDAEHIPSYVTEIIDHDLKAAGNEPVVRKVHDDLLKHNIDISEEELRSHIAQYENDAWAEIRSQHA